MEQKPPYEQISLKHFQFRLSERKPRDIELSQWIKADIESGHINVSEVVKELLYQWYIQRTTGEDTPRRLALPQKISKAESTENLMDLSNPLVQSLLNLKHDSESM